MDLPHCIIDSPTPLSPHPRPSILDGEPPSSTNAAEISSLSEGAAGLISRYPAVAADDHIQRVLRAALQYLPMEGRLTMMREVTLLGEDWDKLRVLRQFFTNAVLKPSKYPDRVTRNGPAETAAGVMVPVLLRREPPDPFAPSSPDITAGVEALMELLGHAKWTGHP